MAFSICYWVNYTQAKLSWKSENAVADVRVLKFLYDAVLNSQCDVTGNTRMIA